MNAFNRVVFILLLLGLMALAVALLIFPYDALRIATVSLQALQESLLYAENAHLWYVGILTGSLVLLLALLYLEIRRPRKKHVMIRTESAGKARIGVESLVQSLGFRIEELPGVRDVRPHIVSYGKDARVSVDVRTSPTVNVPQVTQQIVDLAHEIIEGQLGVKIRGKVEINVAHEPFPRGTLAPGAVAAAPRPAEEPATSRGERPAEPARPEAPRAQPTTVRPEPEAPRPEPAVPPPPPLDARLVPNEDEFDLRPGDLGLAEESGDQEPNEG